MKLRSQLLASLYVVVASLILPGMARAATFDVTYSADRPHADRSHTHESAYGYATRSSIGIIGFMMYNPDSSVCGGWVAEGGGNFRYTADFDIDCWYEQYATGTADLDSSWHMFKADFGDSYIVAPSGGRTVTACNTLVAH